VFAPFCLVENLALLSDTDDVDLMWIPLCALVSSRCHFVVIILSYLVLVGLLNWQHEFCWKVFSWLKKNPEILSRMSEMRYLSATFDSRWYKGWGTCVLKHAPGSAIARTQPSSMLFKLLTVAWYPENFFMVEIVESYWDVVIFAVSCDFLPKTMPKCQITVWHEIFHYVIVIGAL